MQKNIWTLNFNIRFTPSKKCHPYVCSDVSGSAPVPCQIGLAPYQSTRSRYSNRAVGGSNKAVMVIREAV